MPHGEHQFGGGRNDHRPNKRRPKSCARLCRSDRQLVANEEPPLGSHLVTPRRGFDHHGIYVGDGNVVQYGSGIRGLRQGQVEEVPLARFARAHTIWVRVHTAPRFDGAEVTDRARSRIGEDRYRLLTNNCEHLCEWCVRDEHRSYQVEHLLGLPRRLIRIWGDLIAWLRPQGNRARPGTICVLHAFAPSAHASARRLGSQTVTKLPD